MILVMRDSEKLLKAALEELGGSFESGDNTTSDSMSAERKLL